jgi:hypothetical protein
MQKSHHHTPGLALGAISRPGEVTLDVFRCWICRRAIVRPMEAAPDAVWRTVQDYIRYRDRSARSSLI